MMTYGVFVVLLIILIAGSLLVYAGLGGSANKGRDSFDSPQGRDGLNDDSAKCPQCGHRQSHQAQYCGTCGAKLHD